MPTPILKTSASLECPCSTNASIFLSMIEQLATDLQKIDLKTPKKKYLTKSKCTLLNKEHEVTVFYGI